MRRKLFATLVIIITLLGSVFAQQRVVKGTITSASDGLTLPGVTVLVKEVKNVGTITDADGRYSIVLPKGAETLVFSFVGMETTSVKIGASDEINVKMVMSASDLGEVVVTALGLKREAKALGFAMQEIGTGDLSSSRELNVMNNLTGKVAGVQISKTSSGTGGSSAITIRGVRSLQGNNQPLFVVDGVPITNIGHSSGGTWNDNDLGDGVGDINPEDVESMTVLKGPSATALYGAKGSNGVILITTKSGKKKKGIGIEINSNLSVETINLIPTFQNYYANGYEDTNIYGSMKTIDGKSYETMDTWHTDSYGPPLDGSRTIVNPFVFPEDAFKKTLVLLPQPADNVANFYDTGITNSNTLSISGGNDKSIVRLSLGNTTMTGIIPNNRLNKQTVMLRGSSQLTDYLSIDAKINYMHDEGFNRPVLGGSDENVTRSLCTMGRYIPMDFLKEYYEKTKLPGSWPGIPYNPYFVVNELKNHDNKDRIIGLVSGTLKFNNWLSLLGRVGTDYFTQTVDKTWPIGAKGGDNYLGRVYNSFSLVKDVNADVILTANKPLSEHFTVNGSVGASILYQERKSQWLDSRKFKAPGVYDVSNCTDIRPATGFSRKEMQSVFMTGQVAYNNYLFLDVTGRNDWSSALGLDNYSFFYPSVSTSFIFTDAFKGIPADILSFGKIRASWAQVGNDSEPYLTKNGYNSTTTTYNGQGLSSMNTSIPNVHLKNELTEAWEVGANLRFLKNRIGVDVTYYNSKTSDQITNAIISSASGYSSVVINAGEIQNKGFECTLNLNPIKTRTGFSWDIAANFSTNESKVVALAPGVSALTLATGGAGGAIVEARVGEKFGNIVGYAYRRAPDGQKIVSADGYYLPTATQQKLGNITPDWIGGLNNTFSYKGFALNVLLDFVQGNELISSTKYQMEAKGTGSWTVEGRRLHDVDANGNQTPLVGIVDGVVEVKDGSGNVSYVKNTKAVDGQTYWAQRAWSDITEEFVLDGSYISLREVMLSYDFNPSLFKKSPIKGMTLSAIGRNLLYLEEHMQDMGVAPESSPNTSASYAGVESISMPTTRAWELNLKLSF